MEGADAEGLACDRHATDAREWQAAKAQGDQDATLDASHVPTPEKPTEAPGPRSLCQAPLQPRVALFMA